MPTLHDGSLPCVTITPADDLATMLTRWMGIANIYLHAGSHDFDSLVHLTSSMLTRTKIFGAGWNKSIITMKSGGGFVLDDGSGGSSNPPYDNMPVFEDFKVDMASANQPFFTSEDLTLAGGYRFSHLVLRRLKFSNCSQGGSGTVPYTLKFMNPEWMRIIGCNFSDLIAGQRFIYIYDNGYEVGNNTLRENLFIPYRTGADGDSAILIERKAVNTSGTTTIRSIDNQYLGRTTAGSSSLSIELLTGAQGYIAHFLSLGDMCESSRFLKTSGTGQIKRIKVLSGSKLSFSANTNNVAMIVIGANVISSIFANFTIERGGSVPADFLGIDDFSVGTNDFRNKAHDITFTGFPNTQGLAYKLEAGCPTLTHDLLSRYGAGTAAQV